jgi:uncharacterized repeat protein (TIGR03803 family)
MSAAMRYWIWMGEQMKIKLAIAFLALAISARAQTYTFSVLHQFHPSPDGDMPTGQVEIDSIGNLYGTTEGGGLYRDGIVWKLARGKETIRRFNGKNGHGPVAGLNGNGPSAYYGTTQVGGDGTGNYGTVFQVVKGVESVVYFFTGGLDGRDPTQGIALDGAGNLYGVSNSEDGGYGGGVFEISQGVFSMIYPMVVSSIAVDSAGDVFMIEGTQGGNSLVELVSGNVDVLYTFPSGTGGEGLAVSPDGSTLTGITPNGGLGYGSIWQWTQAGGMVDLYQFPASMSLQNANPPVTFDGLGHAFGTIQGVGGTQHVGLVYEVNLGTTNPPVILHQFADGNDGAYPYGPLTIDASGNLYGTASNAGKYQRGTVFKLTKK